ncbi:MAG: BACON domain-containing protein [Sulfuricella sp.]
MPTQAGVNDVLISGRAAKGTILNATVRATQIINGQLSGIQRDAALGPNGDFSVSMPKGLVHLQVIPQANSTTQDEATGIAVALPPEFTFRAAADLTDSTSTTISLNITPFSEAGVALAEKSGGLTAANINKANSGIANILGFDYLSTKPIQSSDTAALASATTNEKKLSVLNAAVSNMAATDALGCGVKASYGQVIDCTVAKLADQFQMNSAASAQPIVVGLLQTNTANSTPMVLLGDQGYQSLLGGIANAVASGATALKNTTVEIVQNGIALSVSAATYAKITVATAINDSQRQIAKLAYQASIQGKDNLITTANDDYILAQMSNLVYDDKWVNDNSWLNGNNPTLPSPMGDYTVLNWLNYGLNANDLQKAWSSGLEWNAFYNSDEIIFAYRGTEPTSVLNWWTDIFGTLVTCQQFFAPQYNLALTQFNTLVSNSEFNKFRGTRKIVVTGHSLGGGIASYIAGNSPLVSKAVGFNSAPLCGLTPFVSGFDESKVYHVNISGEPVSSLDFFYQGIPPISYPNPYVTTWTNLIDSHSMSTVLFALDAAKGLCTPALCPSLQNPGPAIPLTVAGIQSSYSTGVTPYRPQISLSGTNLSAINQISWACTQPNGAACPGSPYVWSPSNWAGKVDIFNDTRIKVYPGLLALGDAIGTYNWMATFSALNSTSVSIPFSVTYQPQATTGIVVESLSSTGFSPGTTTISTTTNPVIPALNVTGENLSTVQRIEWRWSGAATGSKTWLISDPTWNSKVVYTADGKLTLSPTVVEANAAWSGTTIWTGTLIDAAGRSQNITFSVVYQPPTTCTPPQVLTNGVCATPPTTCIPPQVLTNGVCVTPPPTCTVSFNASGSPIDASGGQRQVILTTSGSSCTWSATSNQSWVHNVTPSSGTAGATLTYTVDPNTSAQSRSATIVAGQATLTVSQLGTSASCTFSLGYTTQSVPAGGGTLSEGLLASNQSCARTAQSNATFITNVSPASGNGDANISYTVAANTSASPRSGTLTIAGQTLTVNQGGSSATAVAAPSIGSISPTTMTASSTALTTLTVNGSNFSTSGGYLQFTDPNGSTYSSATYPARVVSVTANQWVYQVNNGGMVGTWQVQVVNANGQPSNAATFSVTAAAVAPSISSISPTTVTAASTALTTLTVNGSNFSTSGGYLQFTDPNGSTYSSATYPARVVSVTANQWVYQVNNGGTVGTWQVQVVNANGQPSNAATFSVTAPVATAPSISSISPTTMTASSTALTTLTVNGSNFSTSGGYLQFTDPNGSTYSSTAYPARVVSVTANQWVYQVNNGGTVGTWQVQVVNANGQPSNSSSFTVTAPAATAIPATPSSMSPGTTGSPGPTLSSGAVTVSWNAVNGATLYIGGITDVATGSSVLTINTSGTSASATLSPAKQYRWFVEACNSTGCSSSSALYYFQTPTTVSGTLPAGYISQGGLTWMPVTFYNTWANANAYCTGTTINGQTGWRIPTQAELSALYTSGAMNGQGWTLLITWSSTANGAGYHYNVGLDSGNVVSYDDTYNSYVSCVR